MELPSQSTLRLVLPSSQPPFGTPILTPCFASNRLLCPPPPNNCGPAPTARKVAKMHTMTRNDLDLKLHSIGNGKKLLICSLVYVTATVTKVSSVKELVMKQW